jgi:hypothetical protein
MKVFISHFSSDIETEERHAQDLIQRGFTIYLDKYDPGISSSRDRPLHIKTVIDTCSDMLVVITENTKSSWWVPFEIGLSTAANARISSIVYDSPQLPSFLRKWPIVDTDQKYGIYLKQLEMNRTELLHEGRTVIKSFDSARASQIRSSELFHMILEAKFAQL